MKKVYITPTVFFDEVLDCGELLMPGSERTDDLTGGGANVNDINEGNTISGDGGSTTTDGFVNSKEGFFDDDIMSDWDF